MYYVSEAILKAPFVNIPHQVVAFLHFSPFYVRADIKILATLRLAVQTHYLWRLNAILSARCSTSLHQMNAVFLFVINLFNIKLVTPKFITCSKTVHTNLKYDEVNIAKDRLLLKFDKITETSEICCRRY